MTSRYRVEYSLKSHRRDEFIEWIKALLAVPFVLHSDIESEKLEFNDLKEYEYFTNKKELDIEKECKKRYFEVFQDVEKLIDNTRALNEKNNGFVPISRLKKLVPSIGEFFTRLPLTEAFLVEDERRSISKRRLVSPSFNDVRQILNTAQILQLQKDYKSGPTKLKLITFDGDVTLYEDGKSLVKSDPIVSRLMKLLESGFFIAVVTAAGYPGQQGSIQYYSRLKGLIDAINESDLPPSKRSNLLVMGGESNYLFRYDNELKNFKFIDGKDWYLPLMINWDKHHIENIMEIIFNHLSNLRIKFNLHDDSKTLIIRKERSIGIIPINGYKIIREYLEEIVLSCANKLNEIVNQLACQDIKVCSFNGGSDVWIDIGDKSLGVESLQKYLCQDENLEFCPIRKSESLHIGDQFASVGANDFKARLSACTAWIASPKETVEILDQLIGGL
ncbi:IMP-specific 5'-nucleotidase 1 [[Candida] jaroonii]|uniref:IMP-specific 5'-nucleotidase 1 n=1 Tax=[Candida] jaroonii TaxID=467808 RepID=A0ACA9YE89_9ASCO|nr:IMP-specific 5'-nucleotidase 1 [[Candida] jaroonii]